MPRALAIVHEEDAGAGVFADETRHKGWDLDIWRIATREPPETPDAYDAVFSFGGSMHADQEDEHPWLRTEKEVLAGLVGEGVPVMGVCLGSQVLAEGMGAPAKRAAAPEIGWFEVGLTPEGLNDPVTGELGPSFEAFQWHSYSSPLPPGAVELAVSPLALQAYRIGDAAWGIQFHAEVAEVDAVGWAVNYAVDEDAVRIGVDPDELSAQILERIGAWNQLGREICGRFLDEAERLR